MVTAAYVQRWKKAYDVTQQQWFGSAGPERVVFSGKVKLLPGRISSGWTGSPLVPTGPDLLDLLLDELDLFGADFLDVLLTLSNTTSRS